jgi:hypothetical protein
MDRAKFAVNKLLQNVKPITQTPRKPPTRYEEYVFEPEDYYAIIDKAYRGKKRRAIEAAQAVKLKPRTNKKTLERGQIVKQVMQQYKLTLPKASKFVKEHGLYVYK